MSHRRDGDDSFDYKDKREYSDYRSHNHHDGPYHHNQNFGKGGGKGNGRNQRFHNMNHLHMNMPMGGGYGDEFGMGVNNSPMNAYGGNGGGYPPYGGRGGPDNMWSMNSGRMMFPPQPQFGGPPPHPPMAPPPPSMHMADEWRGPFGDQFGMPPRPMRAPLPPSLGPDEQLTVKCTGIPQYVKEIDLYRHFITFGGILKILLTRLGGGEDETESRTKVYNEALIQFEEVDDAKKCLGSPQSVLDNRFIKLFPSKENIIAPADIPQYLENDDAEVYPGFRKDEPSLKHYMGKGGKGGGRGGKGAGRFGGKGSRYGGRGGQEIGGASSNAGAESNDEKSPQDEEAALLLKEQQKVAAKAKREEVKAKREMDAKNQYEELKQLRHQADSITRKKEELLQGQIDQFRSMMSKVEKICGTDEAEKARMMESLENKVMSLQAKLQDVRSGTVMETEGGSSGKGFRGGGYKGSGGRGYKGGYRGGKGGGRGGFKGGGRKGFHGTGGKGSRSLDNRSKVLLVSGAPDDFLKSAHVHFSK